MSEIVKFVVKGLGREGGSREVETRFTAKIVRKTNKHFLGWLASFEIILNNDKK